MGARHGDIVHNPHIAILTSANEDLRLATFVEFSFSNWHKVFSVDDMEHFLLLIRKTLEDYEVFLRLLHTYNIYDLIVVQYLEGEWLLA